MGKTENYTRTDLACEWGRQGECRGTVLKNERWTHGEIQYLRITDDAAATELGRPVGEYVTVRSDKIWKLSPEAAEALEETVAKNLLRMLAAELGRPADCGTSVLVIGLGNREITADALGPFTVERLLVTRHLREQEPGIFRRMDCPAVSALSPGVLGQTGMEVLDILKGTVARCAVDAVIAVDALAARSLERLAATVQLSTAGIEPGAGIGNGRCALRRESLGVPVIALGIPTVVDSSTLVFDALREAGFGRPEGRLKEILENGRRFYVSPKEADLIARRTSGLLAHAINRAFVGVPELG